MNTPKRYQSQLLYRRSYKPGPRLSVLLHAFLRRQRAGLTFRPPAVVSTLKPKGLAPP